ncbi:MAG: ribosome silencing factor [Planctomycetes bacterium]|nr:ribosome silencing factor [Planctomycetota bacterium]
MASRDVLPGREIAIFAACEADEKKGEGILVYDLRGLSDVTDYFVLVTAQSKLQIRAILNAIEKGLKDRGVYVLGQEGDANSQWMLLDYADCVIHVFSPELRQYYNLEALWGDAPRVDWQASATARPAAASRA